MNTLPWYSEGSVPENEKLASYFRTPLEYSQKRSDDVINRMLPQGATWDELRASPLYTVLLPWDTNVWVLGRSNPDEIETVHRACLDNCTSKWTSVPVSDGVCVFRFTGSSDLVWFKLMFSERMTTFGNTFRTMIHLRLPTDHFTTFDQIMWRCGTALGTKIVSSYSSYDGIIEAHSIYDAQLVLAYLQQ